MFRSTVLVALCVAAGSAAAGELDALQGGSVDIGAFRGVVYYTEAEDGYRVVTTIAEGEAGLPVRFEATLGQGQSLTISVPGRLHEPSRALEISHAGGRLLVTRIDSAAKLVRADQ